MGSRVRAAEFITGPGGNRAPLLARPALLCEKPGRLEGVAVWNERAPFGVENDDMDMWTYIRLSRANPPGLATKNEARRLTYSAALQQAEELLTAARSSGWASRPLPLFYALSQSARAVAAAVAEDRWELRGHGLKMKFESHPMESLVSPRASGSFPRISELLGSRLSGPVALAEVWAALPTLADKPGPSEVARPLYIEHVEDEYPLSAVAAPVRAAVVFPPQLDDDHYQEVLQSYPAVAGALVMMESRRTSMGYGRVISWPGRLEPRERFQRIRELVGVDSSSGGGWLLPGVGEEKDLLPPFLLWWILLYGFSMLARYEPRRWRELLDVDASRWAVAVENALDVGIEALPGLLLDALSLAEE